MENKTPIKLIETDSLFLEKTANIINNEWFYMPYWFKKVGDGLFIQYSFDQLPDELKTILKKEREG